MCLHIIRNIYNEPVTKKATFGYKIIQEDMYGFYSMYSGSAVGLFRRGDYFYCYTLNKWMNSELDDDGTNFPQCQITIWNEHEVKTNDTYFSGFHSYKHLYSLVDNYPVELINTDFDDETKYWAFKVQIDEIIVEGYEIGKDGYKNLVLVSKKIKLVRRIPQKDLEELYYMRRKRFNENY